MIRDNLAGLERLDVGLCRPSSGGDRGSKVYLTAPPVRNETPALIGRLFLAAASDLELSHLEASVVCTMRAVASKD